MMLALIVAMAACGSDPADGGNNGGNNGGGNSGGGSGDDDYTEGVILPSSTSLSCSASVNDLQIAVTVEKGYTVETSDNRMVEVVEGASATVGGRYLVKFKVYSNPKGEARSCTVLITVDGYKPVELCQISQKAGTGSKVNEWIAKRLNDEYLWLDEYRTMGYRFDYTLSYSNFLDYGLKLMETNYMDGKTIVNADGSKRRELYSYIMQDTRAGSTRAGATMTTGYGISLVPVAWSTSGSSLVYFIINHVYPGSSAEQQGFKRGDIIVGADGSRINNINYSAVYNQIMGGSSQTIKIEKSKESFAISDPNNVQSEEIVLTKSAYYENPVGYTAVLDLKEYEDFQPLHNRKIGYISYLAFEHDYEQQLINAIKDFANQGITDLIVDLRTNGGGSVSIAQEFVSMIIPESYVGQTVCTLSRNPRNAVAKPEELKELVPVVKNDMNGVDLPNLNLEEIWFIGSYASASASELMIKGCEGLDIKTHLIGVPTHGKNTGMDVVMHYPIEGKYYTFAPITFIFANAKGDSDFYNGIIPEVNIASFITGAKSDDVKEWAKFFGDKNYACPDAVWGDFENDLALCEVLMQMMGKSMKDWQSESSAAATTRSAVKKLPRQQVRGQVIEVFNPKGGTQFVREDYNRLMDAQ